MHIPFSKFLVRFLKDDVHYLSYFVSNSKFLKFFYKAKKHPKIKIAYLDKYIVMSK